MKEVIKSNTKITNLDVMDKNQGLKKFGTAKDKQIISGLRILQKRIDMEELDTFSLKFHFMMKFVNFVKKHYAIWITPLFMLVTQILVIMYALSAEGLYGVLCWLSIIISLVCGVVVTAKET